MHDFDSGEWREPEDRTELHIIGFWSAIHTRSHYFLLLAALTALNTWTIKTLWFPVTAGKVMSMGNLSLAPLKPTALPLWWPEEFEWVCWAVAMPWFGQIQTWKKPSSHTEGLPKRFMQMAALSLDLGDLWLGRFLEKILTFLSGSLLGEQITTW